MLKLVFFRVKILVYAFFLLTIFQSKIKAQLAGTYSIPNDFATFGEAIDSLVAVGVSDSVIFNVSLGNYPEVLTIPQISGTSQTNTITFRNNGNLGDVLIQPLQATSLELANILSNNIVFDGLEFKTNNIFFERGISIFGENTQVKNCRISLINTYSNTEKTGIYISNSNCIVDNNEIKNCKNGIYAGTTLINSILQNNIISNNTISNIVTGISIERQEDCKITYNRIFDTFPFKTSSASTGINIIYDEQNFSIEISNNQIYDLTDSRVYGIYNSNGYQDLKIFNNLIYNLNGTESTYGIYLQSNFGIKKLYNNSVILNYPLAQVSTPLLLNANSILKNNLLVNLDTKDTAYSIVTNNPQKLFSKSDFNNFYSNGPFLADIKNYICPDLNTLQQICKSDQNSLSVLPTFVSNSDFHIDENQFSFMQNAGTPIPFLTTDIDGEIRSSLTPDIGADEFTSIPLTNDIGITSKIDTFYPQNQTITFQIKSKNFTQNLENFEINAILENQSNQSFLNLPTQNISLNGFDSTNVSFQLQNPQLGKYKIKFSIDSQTDDWKLNDQIEENFQVIGYNELPFEDKFTIIDSSKWIFNITKLQTHLSLVYSPKVQNIPSTPYALMFQSTNDKSDTLTSNFFNLKDKNTKLEYKISRAGYEYAIPGPTDSFYVEYLNKDKIWKLLPNSVLYGTYTPENYFFNFTLPIPLEGLHSHFQFRFISQGNEVSSSFAPTDPFFIDDVKLTNTVKSKIEHTPFSSTSDTLNTYKIKASISSIPFNPTMFLNWKLSSDTSFTTIQMPQISENLFQAEIPSQPLGSVIQYFLEIDELDILELKHPENAPLNLHFFSVSEDLSPKNVIAHSYFDNAVPLTWDFPTSSANFFAYTNETNETLGFNEKNCEIATKFSFYEKSLKGLKIDFSDTKAKEISVKIYSVGKDGKPNKLLTEVFNGIAFEKLTLDFQKPFVFEEKQIFISLSQNQSNSFDLAVKKDNLMPSNTFFVSKNESTKWQNFEQIGINAIPSIAIFIGKKDPTIKATVFNTPTGKVKKLQKSNRNQPLTSKKNYSFVKFQTQSKNCTTLPYEEFFKRKIELKSKKSPNQLSSLNLQFFRVYRSLNSSDLATPSSNFLIYETSDSQTLGFVDSGVVNGNEYFYTVTAVYADSLTGNLFESQSSKLSKAKPLDIVPPKFPNKLRTNVENNKTKLTWQNPILNIDGSNIEDLEKLNFYRQDNDSTDFKFIGSTNFANPFFEDTFVKSYSKYFVTAEDSNGNESQGSSVAIALNQMEFGNIILNDNLENPIYWNFESSDEFTQWKIDNTPKKVLQEEVPYNGNYCLNYNNNFNYNSWENLPNSGTATYLKQIDLEGILSPKLIFRSLYETEEHPNYDRRFIEVSADSFKNIILSEWFQNDEQGLWLPKVIELDSSWKKIQIRFRFDTIDNVYNNYAGWFIDDLTLVGGDVQGPQFLDYQILNDSDNFTEPFEFKAKVIDYSGVDSVWLNYRFENQINFQKIKMDLVNNNEYSFFLNPPSIQNTNSTNCQYFYSAIDSMGNLSYSPSEIPINFKIELFPPQFLTAKSDSTKIDLDWLSTSKSWKFDFDDGTSEFQQVNSPSGLNAFLPISFATKFTFPEQILGTSKIEKIKIYFTNSGFTNIPFKLKIFKIGLNGLPSNIIWEENYFQDSLGVFIDFEVNKPLIQKELFFIIEQTTSTPISLGGDINGTFSPNTHLVKENGNWSLIENSNFGQVTPMIRCVVKANQAGNFNSEPSYTLLDYNLYKLNSNANNSKEIVENGNLIFSGLTKNFSDLSVTPQNFYSYTVTATYNVDGDTIESIPSNFIVESLQTLVKPNSEILQLPTEFSLSQNYPNPFNPTTKIKFGIPEKAFTKLEIFNVLGQKVKTLVNKNLEPSFYELQWNGTNNSGKSVSSGVYFYRLEAGNFVETRKMLFLK